MKELDNSIHLVLKEPNSKKRLAKVKQLVKKGTDLTKRNENLETPLHVAISQGFEDVAEILIKKLPVEMLNTICRSGLTPLYLAVWKNDFKIAHLLLQHGASASRDSFVKDLNLRTPLQVAFHFKNFEMINLLLEYRAEVFISEASELRKLSLEWAMDQEYANIIISMVENGKCIPYETKSLALDWEKLENGEYISYWKKPLVLKLAKSPKMAEQFLKHLFSEDLKVDFKIAIQYDMDGVIDYFIKSNPSVVNSVDSLYDYLYYAVERNRHQMVELLIRYGFDVNAKANHDDTALHYVSHSTKMAKILIDNGANVNAKTTHGCTPIHMQAVHSLSSNVIEFLIINGAEIDAKSNKKETPLMMALANRKFEIISCLSKLGASMKNRNDQGMCPLEVAIGKNLTPLSFKVLVFNMCR